MRDGIALDRPDSTRLERVGLGKRSPTGLACNCIFLSARGLSMASSRIRPKVFSAQLHCDAFSQALIRALQETVSSSTCPGSAMRWHDTSKAVCRLPIQTRLLGDHALHDTKSLNPFAGLFTGADDGVHCDRIWASGSTREQLGSQPLLFSRSASPACLHLVKNLQGRGPGTALLAPVDEGAIPASSSSCCRKTGQQTFPFLRPVACRCQETSWTKASA